jgi:N-acetyl-gamma-glutamyl-phosphate reductase
MNKKVAIIGAQGYSGRELAKLLLRHPAVELAGLFTTTAGWSLADEIILVETDKVPVFSLKDLEIQKDNLDILFLATPAEVSAELCSQLQNYSGVIIDMSGAFRLNHRFCYGLSPWNQQLISNNRIANPGCYATAVLMTLLPLLRAKIICVNGIIIDAKSGISGAGRQANTAHLFSEIHNDFFPYKLGCHPHAEEIKHYCKEFADADVEFTLVNYILPLHRGIHITVYADPIIELESELHLQQKMTEIYNDFYQDYDLVKHAYYQEQKNPLKHLKSVAGSARTHITYRLLNKKILIFTSIDNLLKGAAAQAVENLNQWLGLPLETALSELEGVL